MVNDIVGLSKTKFISGRQCHKKLYLDVHSPELGTEKDKEVQARLELGKDVGKRARKRFPTGVLVDLDHFHLPEALVQTAELFNDPMVQVIFEGAFRFDDVLVRADILERCENDSWRLIEVKGSTKVKDEHLSDLAIESYVLRGSGVSLKSLCVMYLNNGYVYGGGELDISQLFSLQDVTAEVSLHEQDIGSELAAMRSMLALAMPPSVDADYHCHEPYGCDFWSHCTKNKPPRWIFNLPGGKTTFQKLAKQGILSIDEIPSNFKLSALQYKVKDNREWISNDLQSVLTAVRYPVHHLDFETISLAIPRLRGMRPYEAIPFQWSDHIEDAKGVVSHREYFCDEARDSREELTAALLEALGHEGTICVYSSYEQTILKGLITALPRLSGELQAVIARLWNLLSTIKDHYYHPSFAGSYSMKSVLPALLPTLNYGDLLIQNGGIAALNYFKMLYEDSSKSKKMDIKEALLKYCHRDTLAMVELRKMLLSKATAGSS